MSLASDRISMSGVPKSTTTKASLGFLRSTAISSDTVIGSLLGMSASLPAAVLGVHLRQSHQGGRLVRSAVTTGQGAGPRPCVQAEDSNVRDRVGVGVDADVVCF